MPKIKIMLEGDRTIDSPEDIGIAHLPGCFRLGYERFAGVSTPAPNGNTGKRVLSPAPTAWPRYGMFWVY